MEGLGSFYDRSFYANQRDASYRAASAILPAVLEVVTPRSLVDVGCGVGTWLAAAGEQGVGELVGVEGDWVEHALLRSSAIRLIRHDLESPLALTERFDLAMSVEVAEHVSEGRAASLIRELCALSHCVLFGAAIPGQGGTNHVNEQWQSYWASLFAASDYHPIDIVRPRFWHRRDLPVHYRQNMLLYVHASRLTDVTSRLPHPLPAWEIDLVHPEVHLWNHCDSLRPRTLGESFRILGAIPAALTRSISGRFARRARSSAAK